MRRLPIQAWAAVGACCLLWIAFGSQVVEGARKHDFLNLYTGASLALDGDFAHLHDPQVQLARERRFVPELDALVPFVRPPFYAALLAPLALIPFQPAFWVWVALQIALLVCCWIWALRRWGPDAVIFGALFLPTALGVAHGQDCVVMLTILIAAYSLAERGRDGWSGAVLGLGLIKFHLFLLWPVALLARRRWRMLSGLAAAVALEALASLALAGASGIEQYARLLTAKDIAHLSPSPELMVNVWALALNVGGGGPIFAALALALFLLAIWRAPLWRLFAATSTACLLIAPHVYGYDASLLLLAIWLAIYCSKRLATRLIATALATPIPFLLTLAGVPWSAAAPLTMLVFLGTLALDREPTPRSAFS